MLSRIMIKRPILALVCILAGCDPQFSTSGNDFSSVDPPIDPPIGDPGPEDPCANALPDGNYRFAISLSHTNWANNTGDVSPGPIDLFVWLVASDRGLSAVEFDIQRDGAELQEAYFTPAGENLFLTWEGSGEVDLAVAGCPRGPRLLGTLHLEAIDEAVQISMISESDHAGAVDCGPCYLLHPFHCVPFVGN
jgi:hypothetical protein